MKDQIRRYDTSKLIEDQYEPGSNGTVLRNLLGITTQEDMKLLKQRNYGSFRRKCSVRFIVISHSLSKISVKCTGNGWGEYTYGLVCPEASISARTVLTLPWLGLFPRCWRNLKASSYGSSLHACLQTVMKSLMPWPKSMWSLCSSIHSGKVTVVWGGCWQH